MVQTFISLSLAIFAKEWHHYANESQFAKRQQAHPNNRARTGEGVDGQMRHGERPNKSPNYGKMLQAEGNRQQATGNRQQATGNRQQATGNRQHILNAMTFMSTI
jgi:hypothetical protein